MSKKKAAVEYVVELDPADKRWNVTRNGERTGAFARDKATAIGCAYRDASREQAQTLGDVRVFSTGAKGKRKQEWPTA